MPPLAGPGHNASCKAAIGLQLLEAPVDCNKVRKDAAKLFYFYFMTSKTLTNIEQKISVCLSGISILAFYGECHSLIGFVTLDPLSIHL